MQQYNKNKIIKGTAGNNYAVVNYEVAHIVGMTAANCFAVLISKHNCLIKANILPEDEYFYMTLNELRTKYGITERQFRPALDKLKKYGLVKVQKKRIAGYVKQNTYKLADDKEIDTIIMVESEKLTQIGR